MKERPDMSEAFHIDPTDGPHAAAGLTNDQVEHLCQLMLWEISIRYSKDDFMGYLETLRRVREENSDIIGQVKYERDIMQFEESVLADLAALPSTADRIVF